MAPEKPCEASRERANSDQRRDHRGGGAASRRRLFECRTPADGGQHRRPDRARDQAARDTPAAGSRARHSLRSEASRLETGRSGAFPAERRPRPCLAGARHRHRLRARHPSFALDPGRRAHLASPDRDLSRKDRAASREAQMHRRGDTRACARAGKARRPASRRRHLPWPLAWHSMGRQGPPRHRGHRDRLGCRALSRSRADERRDRREEARGGRRRPRRQDDARRARLWRHLV